MFRENLHNTFAVFFTPAFLQLKNDDGLTRKKFVALGLPMLRAGTDILLDDLARLVAYEAITDKSEYELVRAASRVVCSIMLIANVTDLFVSTAIASRFDIK